MIKPHLQILETLAWKGEYSHISKESISSFLFYNTQRIESMATQTWGGHISIIVCIIRFISVIRTFIRALHLAPMSVTSPLAPSWGPWSGNWPRSRGIRRHSRRSGFTSSWVWIVDVCSARGFGIRTGLFWLQWWSEKTIWNEEG